MNFYDFFYMMEATFGGEDPMTMNVDDVQLTGDSSEYTYTYSQSGETYRVTFGQTSISLNDASGYKRITNKAYSIVFSGPNGVSLTGRGQALAVYKGLLKGVRKLIDQVKPEGLSFYGAHMEQELMYHTFYEKFLHQAFTAVDPKSYLANWFIEQLKTSSDPRWQVVEAALAAEEQDRPQRRERLEQEKAQKRERRQQTASRMQAITPNLRKIAYDSYNAVPAYLDRIDADNGAVVTRYMRGRRISSGTTEPTYIKDISEMPPDKLPDLQKLVAKLKADGVDIQFLGNPPDGWDQPSNNPMDNIDGKIAYGTDHGPIYIKNYDDYYDEVNIYYVSGSYLESGYTNASRVKPIDQMPQEHYRTLRKLIKKVEENNGPFTPQFLGNPPAGWDQAAPSHEAVGKIAYNPDYGPVYIERSEEGESRGYYADYRNRVYSVTIDDSEIKKIDETPNIYLPRIQHIINYVKRRLGVQDPQFYGNPPENWDADTNIQRGVGKIAWTNWTETPVYIQSINGNQAVCLYPHIDGPQGTTGEVPLKTINVDLDGIEPIGRDNRSWRFRRGWDQLVAGLRQMGISNPQEWAGDGQPGQDVW